MSDEELCAIATAYVTEDYAKVGDRTYYWEEWDDPTNDTTAHGMAGCLPPSEGSYFWAEIVFCEVLKAEICDRTDEGVLVEVRALVAVTSGGTDDEDEDEDPEPEERLISCWLEQDSDGNWNVENAEE